MSSDRRRARQLKAAVCILALAVAVTLFNVGHAFDGFLPKHLAVGYEAFGDGTLPSTYLTEQIPGFHAFVALLFVVLDIDPFLLHHFPVQVVPYAVTFFALVYVVSDRNALLAAAVTGLLLLVSPAGTWRLTLWPHGFGDVILFTVLVGLLVLLGTRSTGLAAVLVLLAAVAVVYVSYNLAAITLLVLVASYLGIRMARRARASEALEVAVSERLERPAPPLAILGITFVMGVAIVLSEFFRSTFVPLVLAGLGVDDLYRFAFVWIGAGPEHEEIAHLLVAQPASSRLLSLSRLFIVGLLLAGFGLYVASKLRTGRPYQEFDVVVSAYVAGLSAYVLVRSLVASIALADLFLPGVVALGYLYGAVEDARVHAVLLVLLVLLGGTVVGTQVENYRHDGIDENLDAVYHLDDNHRWLDVYVDTGDPIHADELTINVLVYDSLIADDELTYEEARAEYALLTTEEAAALTTYEDPGEGCYVLNNHPDSVTLEEWLSVTSWDTHGEEIHANPNVDKVHADGDVWVFCG